jgi:hypothetical protein
VFEDQKILLMGGDDWHGKRDGWNKNNGNLHNDVWATTGASECSLLPPPPTPSIRPSVIAVWVRGRGEDSVGRGCLSNRGCVGGVRARMPVGATASHRSRLVETRGVAIGDRGS